MAVNRIAARRVVEVEGGLFLRWKTLEHIHILRGKNKSAQRIIKDKREKG